MKLGMYMVDLTDHKNLQSRIGWSTPHGADECATCVVQTETLAGYKFGHRFRETLKELNEPYIITEGVDEMYIWVRLGVWEVFKSYFKPRDFTFAELTLVEYMRSMLP